MIELITYYVIGGALLVGAPAIFLLIVFMPALQNTKGRHGWLQRPQNIR
jgi:hypothetical protein